MMMQISGSEADAAMLKRTEEAYSQVKSELAQLGAKYLQLQRKDAKRSGLQASTSCVYTELMH